MKTPSLFSQQSHNKKYFSKLYDGGTHSGLWGVWFRSVSRSFSFGFFLSGQFVNQVLVIVCLLASGLLFHVQFGEGAVLACDLFWCAEALHFGSFVKVGLAFAFYHSWDDMTSDIVIGLELEHFDNMRRSFWSFHEGFDAVSQAFDNAFTFIDQKIYLGVWCLFLCIENLGIWALFFESKRITSRVVYKIKFIVIAICDNRNHLCQGLNHSALLSEIKFH